MPTKKVTCPNPECRWRFDIVVRPDIDTALCPRCKGKFAIESADTGAAKGSGSAGASAPAPLTVRGAEIEGLDAKKTYIPLQQFKGRLLLYAVKDGEDPPTKEEFYQLVLKSSARDMLAALQESHGGFYVSFLTADYLAEVVRRNNFPKEIVQTRYDEIQFGLMTFAAYTLRSEGVLTHGVPRPWLLHREDNLYLFALQPLVGKQNGVKQNEQNGVMS